MAMQEHQRATVERLKSKAQPHEPSRAPSALLDAALYQRWIDEIDLRRTWRTLWRWRGLIAAVTAFAAVLSIVVVESLTPVYTATTQIAIAPPQIPLFKADQQMVADLRGDSETVSTEVSIVRSRKIAQKTVLKLGLDSVPEFNPRPGLRQRVGAFIRDQNYIPLKSLDRFFPTQDDPEVGVDQKLNGVVDAVLDRLKVSNDGKSRVLTLSFPSTSPELAARIVNTIADFYITAQLDAKLDAAKRANLWLSDQVATLRQEVVASDEAAQKFRREHNLLRGQTSTITSQEISQVAAEAVTAHTKSLEAQSRLVQLQRSGLARGPAGLSTLPEVQQSQLIQNLSSQEAEASRRLADLLAHYGEKHPSVINLRAELSDIHRRLQSEMARVADSLRTEVANQQARENSLVAMLEKAKAAESRSNSDEVQLHELEREAEANKALYENFLQRFKETQSQTSFARADAEIISPAVTPADPTFPQKTVLIILSIMTGLVLGALLAMLSENMDVGLRSMEQVREILHLNPLGMIPTLAGEGKRSERQVLDHPLSSYSEALRTMQANIALSDIDSPQKTILITSSLPGEGKSTTALSLGHMMARDGQRTLLIDCDLRRPTLHKLSGANAGPGLVDLLLGRCDLSEIVQVNQESGLEIITAGNLPSVPPNLLASQRFQQLLKHMRQQYDIVLLDSAPVLAIADTRVLSSVADKTVFVVRWASTSRKVVAAALEQLQRAGCDLAGVVLTQVNVKGHAKDGFSDSVLYTGKLKHYYRSSS